MEHSEIFLGVGSRIAHPSFGDGVVIKLHQALYDVCFFLYGIKSIAKDYDKWEIIEKIPADGAVTFSEAERSLIRILKTWSDVSEIIPLGDRWEKGTLILQPADEKLKSKEIPIEVFFHKIVMLRDRLRVLEQRINSSELNDEEKINLQQYITRIYGTLTTFNTLFSEKEHYFVGEKA